MSNLREAAEAVVKLEAKNWLHGPTADAMCALRAALDGDGEQEIIARIFNLEERMSERERISRAHGNNFKSIYPRLDKLKSPTSDVMVEIDFIRARLATIEGNMANRTMLMSLEGVVRNIAEHSIEHIEGRLSKLESAKGEQQPCGWDGTLTVQGMPADQTEVCGSYESISPGVFKKVKDYEQPKEQPAVTAGKVETGADIIDWAWCGAPRSEVTAETMTVRIDRAIAAAKAEGARVELDRVLGVMAAEREKERDNENLLRVAAASYLMDCIRRPAAKETR